jgi:uncharacterized DUF497 family protein
LRRYVWDEAKRRDNVQRHGIDFTAVESFDWDTAFVHVDDREDYGELREIAIGFIGPRLHVLTFTHRGRSMRIISLRRAEKSDARKYAEAIR